MMACTPENITSEERQGDYFDLVGFTETQVKLLDEQQVQVSKNIHYGDSSDTITTHSIDWEEEFKLFREVNLNKPVLKDAFTVDSLDHKGQESITYTAKESDMKIKKVVIVKEDSIPVSIEVFLERSNFLFSNTTHLQMHLQKGVCQHYLIEGQKQVILMGEDTYKVEGRVL
ncbi:hypothetical protein GCM10023331_03840 [Algivirga pacifica]|uniref:LPS export ABC transporter periplasmic protein LptC n=2 Tax=Algivirga pacifica TaxID=1162670 RepID=A0ABP9D5E5_9BACT